ncbi:MAG: sugar phosphate isomerase/epimerase family protein [Anaerolineae bacterium]|jgi:sugar phosphate isomerase/epimerase
MRLGLSSFIYRYATSADPRNALVMDHTTLLRRALALELDLVQFADNMPLHLLGDEALADLGALSRQLGVAIEVGTKGMDRDLLSRYVSIATHLGSRALRLVLDVPQPSEAQAGLRWLLPQLERAALPLAIENHGEFPAAALAEIVRQLGHPLLGFCADTANNLLLLEPPLQTLTQLAPRALQLHLKDYAVERAPVGYRITGRQLGEGQLDMAAALACIQPVKRNLDVMLEAWMDPAGDWAETLLREEKWIASAVTRARRLLAAPTA